MAVQCFPMKTKADVVNRYLRHIGFSPYWGFYNIMSLDVDEAVHVPHPSLAVILLLPITEKYREFIQKQQEEIDEIELLPPDRAEIYYIKQRGTLNSGCKIALLHAIANNYNKLEYHIRKDSILDKFLRKTLYETPEGRARKFEKKLAPQPEEDFDLHFITIVNVGNRVIELDGRKNGPIVHDITTRECFLQDAFRVCQKYIDVDPYNLRYSAWSLGWLY